MHHLLLTVGKVIVGLLVPDVLVPKSQVLIRVELIPPDTNSAMDNGELFAMMVLVHLMATLFADNRDTLELQDLILSPC